ncbi:MAG: RICIN domain-containing protein [Pseudonocardia sp.]
MPGSTFARQVWRFDGRVPEARRVAGTFINARTHDCLDASRGAIGINVPVVRWPCDDRSNQYFVVAVEAIGE